MKHSLMQIKKMRPDESHGRCTALRKAGCRRERQRIGPKERDIQRVGIRGAYRVFASRGARGRIGKRVCRAEALPMVLIEGVALNSAGGVAGCSVGRCTARAALSRKIQAADDP